MKKQGSVFVESLIVFFVIISCVFVGIHFWIFGHKQEKYIVEWFEAFSDIRYVYSILLAQSNNSTDIIVSDLPAKIKSYLRMNNRVNSSFYSQRFMNKQAKKKEYEFKEFYKNDNHVITGFKWINQNCGKNQLCAVMSIDINGEQLPNIWGLDIFGVNFYTDRVEPAGQTLKLRELKRDCSKHGSGVSCSTYYLIGGMVEK